MTHHIRIILAGLLVSLGTGASSHGQAVPWNHPDQTTHWYEVVSAPSGTSWDQAQSLANRRNGHLVTITSVAENALVSQLVNNPSLWVPGGHGPWIGGMRRDESGPQWMWVDGEAFAYDNWAPGAPMDVGSEARTQFARIGGAPSPMWRANEAEDERVYAYVVEWDDSAWDHTVGVVFNKPGSHDGYTLITEETGTTYLIDNEGRTLHGWASQYGAALSVYLLDNGDIIRAARTSGNQWGGIFVGGVTGRIEQVSWNSALIWDFQLNNSKYILHHDLEPLPNGNVLAIVFEKMTATEAIDHGRDPGLLSQGELWPERIIEIQPTGLTSGQIVWEWRVWDHVIQDHDPTKPNYGTVSDHPELVDLNHYGGAQPVADWLHFNAIDWNPALDQIVVSSRTFDEIWIIDHSTSTAEAASHSGGNSGHGGDLLYRWGNPSTYRRGTNADHQLFGQHNPEWIPPGRPGAGNITLFNNGTGRPGYPRSTIEEITPPINASGNYQLGHGAAWGPAAPTHSFGTPFPSDLYSPYISGTQRLSNGSDLICEGMTGTLMEVTPTGEIVWRYVNPVASQTVLNQGDTVPVCNNAFFCNNLFRARRYEPTHPAFVGRSLIPGLPIEQYQPEVVARVGNVNSGVGLPADVLFVNGEAGDVWRHVYASPLTWSSISIGSSPSGPIAADYMLFMASGEPGPASIQTLPMAMGTSAIPMYAPNGPMPVPLASSISAASLWSPLLPITPAAPITFVGALPIGTYTFQAVVRDLGSSGALLSVTNAVVLTVY